MTITDDYVFFLRRSEQFMMASKALRFSNFEKSVWEADARRFVFDGNVAKFGQNADILDVLLNTGERTIVEASPSDRMWGVGLAEDDPLIFDKHTWDGTNWLGDVLMAVRRHFRESAR